MIIRVYSGYIKGILRGGKGGKGVGNREKKMEKGGEKREGKKEKMVVVVFPPPPARPPGLLNKLI